jgi:hypothetical protein
MPSPQSIQAVRDAEAKMNGARDALRALVESDERAEDYAAKHRALLNNLNAAMAEFLVAIERAGKDR